MSKYDEAPDRAEGFQLCEASAKAAEEKLKSLSMTANGLIGGASKLPVFQKDMMNEEEAIAFKKKINKEKKKALKRSKRKVDSDEDFSRPTKKKVARGLCLWNN